MYRAFALALCACGRIGFDPGSAASGDDGAIAEVWTKWSTPTQVTGSGVASNATDWEPALHPNGKVLVFNRTSDFSTTDLFVATRTSTGGSFTTPQKVSFSLGGESGPAWSPDGSTLYLSSSRNGSIQLFTSAFDGSTGFSTPVLVDELKDERIIGVTISPGDLEMFYNDDDLTNAEIRRASRTSTTMPWVLDGPVDALNSSASDGWPSVSPDGLALFFESSRDNLAGYIYVATRADPGSQFTTIEKVDALDDGIASGDPDLTPDGAQIWFGAERAGGAGGQDIYFANRLP